MCTTLFWWFFCNLIYYRYMRLFSKHTPTVLYLTITSGTISGSLYGTEQELLYTCDVPLPTDRVPLRALAVASATFFEQFHAYPHSHQIDEIHICLYALWFKSGVKNIRVQNEKTFIVTPTFLTELIEQESQTFLKESHISDKEILIEKSIVHTKINGYDLSSPVGKKTKYLEATLFFSFIQEDVLQVLQKAILEKHGIQGVPTHFHTFPYISSMVLQRTLERNQFTLFAVTDHFTEVVMVREGVPYTSFDIPIGKETMVGFIGTHLGIAPEVASSLLALYIDDVLEEDSRRDVEEAITVLTKDMLIAFHRLYTASIDTMKMLDIYILADMHSTFLWKKTLEREEKNTEEYEKIITISDVPVAHINTSSVQQMTVSLIQNYYTEH